MPLTPAFHGQKIQGLGGNPAIAVKAEVAGPPHRGDDA